MRKIESMSFIVCVKMVPGGMRLQMDNHRKTVMRSAEDMVINVADWFAAEMSLRCKDQDPGAEVTFLSMADPSMAPVP